ncbi:unnamed protein product [Penicillium salamii]|nr:unnamed protein product [Penicillium salamii]CAG7996550.1 unnamed protein product [Penicillium salamii]CAG8163879.1 unnamed protein product [Penicillium salamii]CAG8193941.1 unnamed protein product [Penicillium salamii]CAG8225280.1 unnamed protein product [Penicillium salamii]
MESIQLGGPNFGSQIAINYGIVNNEFTPDLDAKLPLVHEATFDSFEDQHESECYPGTRVDLLRQVKDWAQTSEDLEAKFIFWLNGVAGTGKSTISRTIAKHFSSDNSLGASFFFKRGEGDRGTAKYLVTTIARQLARSIPELLPIIEQVTRDSPSIATKTMKQQFDQLIIHPLLKLSACPPRSHAPTRTIMIVIDALDECEGDNNIRLILQLLPQLPRSNMLRLGVFLTSRPELEIRVGFSNIQSHRDFILHRIPKEVIEHDLSLFLHRRFFEIGTKRSLPSDWFNETTIQDLVSLSCPLFIFAATVCRMLEDSRFDPAESLVEILGSPKHISNLDKTYLPVLSRLVHGIHDSKRIQHLVEDFQRIVGPIITLCSPLSVVSLSQLVDVPETTIRIKLDPLHSVLSVPEDNISPIRLVHLSFRDFLVDCATRNKTSFGIDPKLAHLNMAIKCISICQKQLRKNICDLPTGWTLCAAINRATINRYISPELQYASRYWVHHLAQCINKPDSHSKIGESDVIDDTYSFLQKHFLHWVEAMSILGIMSEVVGMIDLLVGLIPNIEGSKLLDLLNYARHFALKNAHIINAAPLQIYSAALIFAPQNEIHQMWACELPSWVSQLPRIDPNWGPELQSYDDYSHGLRGIVFSPDGRYLASMSNPVTIKNLWTGTLQITLEVDPRSHFYHEYIRLEFSPDSRILASMSPNFIHVWDLATGALQLTIEVGHLESSFKWFSFSPDSRTIACLSTSGLLRLYDTATPFLMHTIDVHPNTCIQAEFSPDGQLLVSLHINGGLMLHDIGGDKFKRTLDRNSGSVCSLTISPDGRFLACGTEDGDVDLFEISTGQLSGTLLGYSGRVLDVKFSPDSRLLTSASEINVQIWDPVGKMLQHEFRNESEFQISISPDSRTVAVLQDEYSHSFWLWDAKTGKSHEIWSDWYMVDAVFSPDSSLLAVARQNGTIAILSCAGGEWRHAYYIYSQSSTAGSMGFLPNSTAMVLAFGSKEGIVRMWDLTDRAMAKDSLKITPMRLSDDGRLLASVSDSQISIWDHMKGSKEHEIKYEHYGNSDHDRSCGYDAIEISSSPPPYEYEYELPLAFSHDNEIVALMCPRTRDIRIWNVSTGILKKTLKSFLYRLGFEEELLAKEIVEQYCMLRFSYNGLLASHCNGIIILWDPQSGAQLRCWSMAKSVTKLWFLEGSSLLATEAGPLGPGKDILKSNLPHVIMLAWKRARALRRDFNQEIERTSENSEPRADHTRATIPGQAKTKITLELNQWIALNGERVLWLAPEFRHARPTIVVDGSMIAFAHTSGSVLFLRFCI